MRRTLLTITVMILAGSIPGTGKAQDVSGESHEKSLVSLDLPTLSGRGDTTGRLDLRLFSDKEDLTYTSLALHMGLGRRTEGILRGSFANRRTFAMPGGGGIRHGGSDVEIAVKTGIPSDGQITTAGIASVSFPKTPAQRDPLVTLGLTARTPTVGRTFAVLNPRLILIESNTLFGFGFGGQISLSGTLFLVAEYTPMIAGNNTRRETTGGMSKRNLHGIAVRYGSQDGRFHADVGFTNATGLTTGAALTPGLGGSGAFYAAFAGRF